jgi:hypothetical protein
MPYNQLHLHLPLHPSGLQWAVAVGDKAGMLSKCKCESHKSNENNDTKNNLKAYQVVHRRAGHTPAGLDSTEFNVNDTVKMKPSKLRYIHLAVDHLEVLVKENSDCQLRP